MTKPVYQQIQQQVRQQAQLRIDRMVSWRGDQRAVQTLGSEPSCWVWYRVREQIYERVWWHVTLLVRDQVRSQAIYRMPEDSAQ